MTDDDAQAYPHLNNLDRVPYWVAFGYDVVTFIAVAVCDRDRLVQERDRLRQEVTENDGVIAVWRGRTERAEAERDRLRAELAAVRAAKPLDPEAVIAAQSHKGGIAAVIGRWPGDETDEQIEAAVRAECGIVVQGVNE